ncbi:hypothetical protein RM697_03120 [Ichthyenterobacterium sp. W332]|uniref:Outer membrane protein beta-barrel domain-containing protein n=1 Tax=Microcosmobacter mediterraneus TaxID=3075607 RepID=A0ABU2YIB4_9FLAO|nr:hypothetical protein [Ichthyenterobacterium sp. W332]MDT0557621.1 hypothetical protein [Ichthyenterobacterium sp. W332]
MKNQSINHWLKKCIIIIIVLVVSNQYVSSQEIIKEIYEIYPISWKNPLMSFEKTQVLKPKYKEINSSDDTIVVNEIINKFQTEMHFRAKCYQVANDLNSDHPSVIEVKDKMNQLLKKWSFYLNLDYKINKEYQEILITQNKNSKNHKEYKKELLKQINELAAQIDNKFPCPGGFSKIRGNIKFENGYLNFQPLKYRIFDVEDPKTKRIKSYLNGEDKYTSRNIGIKLKSNELVQLKNTNWAFGALTMPIKIYATTKQKDSNGGDNVFTDTNVSFFASKQWGYHGYNSKGEIKRKKAHSVNFLLGVSKITLDQENSSRTEDTDFNLLAASPGLAYGFNLNKFGIFVGAGFDIPLHKEGNKWYFNKQLWIGFGLGFSVFK